MTTWTRTIVLRWRPNVEFYAGRTAILRALEDSGQLDGFNVTEDRIAAQVGPSSFLEVGAAAAVMIVKGPLVTVDDARSSLEAVWMILAPRDLHVARMHFQTLVPIVGEDGGAAQARTGSNILGRLFSGATVDDWSALVDGHSASSGPFQVEVGIVGITEIPQRLDRSVGRIARSEMPMLPQTDWDGFDLPEAAFFADWNWFAGWHVRQESPVDGLIDLWTSVQAESESMADGMYEAQYGSGGPVARGAN